MIQGNEPATRARRRRRTPEDELVEAAVAHALVEAIVGDLDEAHAALNTADDLLGDASWDEMATVTVLPARQRTSACTARTHHNPETRCRRDHLTGQE